MKLKELIKADSQYKVFKDRLDFYENSWDVTQSISNYLNSPDVKKQMEEEGPYVFKELSSQDQMVLIKLQYEGKIKELEGIVEKQKEELSYYRERSEDHRETRIMVFDSNLTDENFKSTQEEEKDGGNPFMKKLFHSKSANRTFDNWEINYLKNSFSKNDEENDRHNTTTEGFL